MHWSLSGQFIASLLLLMMLNTRLSWSLTCYSGTGSKASLIGDSLVDSSSPVVPVQCSKKNSNRQSSVNTDYEYDSSNFLQANATKQFDQQEMQDEEYSDDSVANCFIFYDAHLDKAEFACDDDNVCNDASERKMTSTCYKGARGALFCCQGDFCNNELYLTRLSPPQAASICYSGTNNGTADISEVVCKSSWCYQTNTYLPNGRVFEQTFGCDVLCDEPDLELTSSVCREYVSHTGMRRRTCYCSSDRCNSVVKQINVDEVNAEPPFPATDAPVVQSSNPEYNLEYVMRRRWFIMVTCVMGGILCLLVILLTTLAVLKCQKNRTKKLSFSYVHLDDDTTANECGEQDITQCKKKNTVG